MAEPLQQELLAIPGIAAAEVESDSGVAGVRVQLAVGADPDAVGAAVRRILADHGMHSIATAAGDQEIDGPPPPPGAPGSVVSFPLVGEHARNDAVAEPDASAGHLESVAVEETPDGVSVSIRSTDGRRADRTLRAGVPEMDEAVVAAVVELTEHGDVSLADLSEHRFGSRTVITVLLATGEESYVTGAAIQIGGRAYAVALATWVGLTGEAVLPGGTGS